MTVQCQHANIAYKEENMSWKMNAGSPFETYKHDAVATNGMVSTNHPLGSAAGLEMLAMGGNAMDAAVASAFALSVVEPMMIGIFGAGFINFYNASDDEFVNIDNYSVAPHAATPDMYETVSDTWPDYMETADRENLVGYRAVGVPWCAEGLVLRGGAVRQIRSGHCRPARQSGTPSEASQPASTSWTSFTRAVTTW